MKTWLVVWGPMLVLTARTAFAEPPTKTEACPTVTWARGDLTYPFPLAEQTVFHVKAGDPARKLLREAGDWPKRCASSEGSWYGILRARELLGCDPRRTLDLAEQASRNVGGSVWIATVRARLLGTVTAAEQAVALDPDHIPAQFALASALLDQGKLDWASKVLRKINVAKAPEVRALKARLYLLKNNARSALAEAKAGPSLGLDGDFLRVEPTSGLDWPWTREQVVALACARLGKASEAAKWLGMGPMGTLPELRGAVANHTKAGEQLMAAMERIVDNPREQDLVRDNTAVSLARLRVLADQPGSAILLVGANPKRRERFCAALAELLWTGGGDKGAAFDELHDMCRIDGPNARPIIEPVECGLD